MCQSVTSYLLVEDSDAFCPPPWERLLEQNNECDKMRQGHIISILLVLDLERGMPLQARRHLTFVRKVKVRQA